MLSVVAFYWPRWGSGGPDPFVLSRPALSYLIALIMFAVGCLLPKDEVREVFRRWPMVAAGTAIQYICMPIIAYACAHLFQLRDEALVGVIMVGCVPGAMASNVLTLLARGNVSFSVSLTTAATMLSPLVVPVTLLLALRAEVALDPVQVSVKLLREVVAPVVLGHVLCRTYSGFGRIAGRAAPAVANLSILWTIAVVVGLNRENSAQVTTMVLWCLLAINALGYAAGYVGGYGLRLAEPMRRALTLELGMQNAGLGTVLSLALFPEQVGASIPPAVYTFGCMFTGTMLAQYWAANPPQKT